MKNATAQRDFWGGCDEQDADGCPHKLRCSHGPRCRRLLFSLCFDTTARCVAGVHAIISSPLILSMDITPAGGQVDLYWPLLSNREAIAGEHRRLLTTLLAELRRS